MEHRSSHPITFTVLRFALIALLVQCIFAPEAFASGAVRGFVTDPASGEAVIYATVSVKGTMLGATTNTKGSYFIPAVPAGAHAIVISIIGYRTKTVQVTVRDDEASLCSVRIAPTTVQMEEMTVVGEKQVRLNETNLGHRIL
jgi:hypothetical protein